MLRPSLLLALIPVVGLVELGLHELFARRAPGFEDYAEMAPALLKLKQPGVPVVVAPAWAEPLVRQAAPSAFPFVELTRPDDTGFASFIEVSLLGQRAPELASLSVRSEQSAGKFRLRVLQNPRPEPAQFDFVTAVEAGEVEVFTKLGEQLTACPLDTRPRTLTGGLHGHLAYPRKRHECLGGRFVGVTVLDDAAYRPRRCILAQAPVSGSVVLRFNAVPKTAKFVGFRGLSYFLERDEVEPAAELELREAGQQLGRFQVVGADGWRRFDVTRAAPEASIEVEVRAAKPGVDACFALEAR
jgi:hypothetical protein